jgi:hypothetical protein
LAVELHRGEVVARRPFVDSFDGSHRRKLILNRHPVAALTSIASTDGTYTWDPDGWSVDPYTGLVSYASGPALAGAVTIGYQAGYREVPPNFILAAQIIAAHLWETQRMSHVANRGASYGDSAPVVRAGYAIPNRALELLGGRPPVIA